MRGKAGRQEGGKAGRREVVMDLLHGKAWYHGNFNIIITWKNIAVNNQGGDGDHGKQCYHMYGNIVYHYCSYRNSYEHNKLPR